MVAYKRMAKWGICDLYSLFCFKVSLQHFESAGEDCELYGLCKNQGIKLFNTRILRA